MALLQLIEVSRRYGQRQALHPIHVTVAAGECVAVIGPNGSGKSTLLRIAAGRDEPTSGTVRFDGAPMSEEDPRTRARIAVVGDSTAYYPDLTVREHLLLVAVAHGIGDAADQWVDWALQEQGLTDWARVLPSSLSTGQLQGLLLGSALVRPRELLLLDEPEQHLDPGARERLAGLLAGEKADGVGMLLATHHVELAHAVADRVVMLDDGRVLDRGTPGDVLAAEAGRGGAE